MLSNDPFLLIGSEPDHACLLLHGLGGGTYQMRLLADYLHDAGLTTQGINYPGHDKPSAVMPRSKWSDWFHHSLEAYEQLFDRFKSVSLIGFSTGSPIALHIAATSSKPVHKLVLLAPFMAIKHQWYYGLKPDVYLYTIGRLIENVARLRLPIRDPEMNRLAEASIYFKTFNLPSVRSALELIEMVKQELPQIQTPTLVIQSRLDSVVDPSGAQFVIDHMGSTQKVLHWLEQSDHILTMDYDREQVFSFTREFLLG